MRVKSIDDLELEVSFSSIRVPIGIKQIQQLLFIEFGSIFPDKIW